MYEAEMMVLIKKDEELKTFDKKIIRGIYSSKQIDEECPTLMNMKIKEFMNEKDSQDYKSTTNKEVFTHI